MRVYEVKARSTEWFPGFASLHIVHEFILSFLSGNGNPRGQHTRIRETTWVVFLCWGEERHILSGGRPGRQGRI